MSTEGQATGPPASFNAAVHVLNDSLDRACHLFDRRMPLAVIRTRERPRGPKPFCMANVSGGSCSFAVKTLPADGPAGSHEALRKVRRGWSLRGRSFFVQPFEKSGDVPGGQGSISPATATPTSIGLNDKPFRLQKLRSIDYSKQNQPRGRRTRRRPR